MNVENILKVADAIEQHSIPDLGFNMSHWFDKATPDVPDLSGHECGTIACIAGWASRVSGDQSENPDHTYEVAADFLGLGALTANNLFMPTNGFVSLHQWNSITPAHAVAVLRHLAETGEVDWYIAPTLTNTNGAK